MWCSLSVQEVCRKLRTNIKFGLTEEEASRRLLKYGKNELNSKKKKSFIKRLINQFKDFMIIILILSSIVSAGISYFQKSNDYIDSIIIIVIVILNAFIGVIQESKAEKSIEALQKLSSPHSKVKRAGILKTIPSEELVPGDLVFIESGNLIPADIRLVSTYNFKVEEATLTGETSPIEKKADVIINSNSALGDMNNLAFASTIAVNGHAEGIVTETGMNTKVGKIAQMIIQDEAPETPLQKRLRRSGKALRSNSISNMWYSICYWYA